MIVMITSNLKLGTIYSFRRLLKFPNGFFKTIKNQNFITILL